MTSLVERRHLMTSRVVGPRLMTSYVGLHLMTSYVALQVTRKGWLTVNASFFFLMPSREWFRSMTSRVHHCLMMLHSRCCLMTSRECLRLLLTSQDGHFRKMMRVWWHHHRRLDTFSQWFWVKLGAAEAISASTCHPNFRSSDSQKSPSRRVPTFTNLINFLKFTHTLAWRGSPVLMS